MPPVGIFQGRSGAKHVSVIDFFLLNLSIIEEETNKHGALPNQPFLRCEPVSAKLSDELG